MYCWADDVTRTRPLPSASGSTVNVATSSCVAADESAASVRLSQDTAADSTPCPDSSTRAVRSSSWSQ